MIRDLTGTLFGYLSVERFSHQAKNRVAYWFCRCRCGKEVVVAGNNLTSGNSRSCGCVHGFRIDFPITQEQLKSLVHYDPGTGKFYWLVNSKNCKSGEEAGHRNQANPYVRIAFKKHSYYAQKLAWLYMTGEWPPDEVDHINMRKDDNAWNNLRLATHEQNSHNRTKTSHNRSGYKGVTRIRNRYMAKITAKNRVIRLGWFETAEDAAYAYDAAAKKHFGKFARTNFGE